MITESKHTIDWEDALCKAKRILILGSVIDPVHPEFASLYRAREN